MMSLRLGLVSSLAVILFAASGSLLGSTTPHEERVCAAWILGAGRLPSAAELSGARGDAPLAEHLAAVEVHLRNDAGAARITATLAWTDAFGTDPAEAELRALPARAYHLHLRSHLERLGAEPDLYRTVIDRAYRAAVGRAAHDVEFAYWEKRPALPYALLVGCIDHWARRNAPGLMTTTGAPTISITCDRILALRCSPSVAQEARALLDLKLTPRAAALGQHVIAPGGATILSAGGIHMVVTGRRAPETTTR